MCVHVRVCRFGVPPVGLHSLPSSKKLSLEAIVDILVIVSHVIAGPDIPGDAGILGAGVMNYAGRGCENQVCACVCVNIYVCACALVSVWCASGPPPSLSRRSCRWRLYWTSW